MDMRQWSIIEVSKRFELLMNQVNQKLQAASNVLRQFSLRICNTNYANLFAYTNNLTTV